MRRGLNLSASGLAPNDMPQSAPAAFEYRRGTIVQIEVWNFVTYEHACVYPNSRLNLVIGPNGSGKSSIVCAMCLGLGGSPRVLPPARPPAPSMPDPALIPTSLLRTVSAARPAAAGARRRGEGLHPARGE